MADISVKFEITGLKEADQSLLKINSSISGISKTSEKSTKSIKDVDSGLSQMGKTSSGLSKSLLAAGAALLGVVGAGIGIKKAVDAAVELENALVGLTSVARNTGNDVNFITSKAKELASDGIIPLSDVSGSLKSLLASGLDGQKAVEVFEALRDAAAFNRQGQLSMAEAVKGAADGIKNQNSVMVDNAGVTKNLSIIIKEYATSVGKSVSQLSEQEKRLAIANGIIKEASLFQGDYNKSLQTFSGGMSKVTGNFKFFLAEFGQYITKSPLAIKGLDLIGRGFGALTKFLADNRQKFMALINDAFLALLKVTPLIIKGFGYLIDVSNVLTRALGLVSLGVVTLIKSFLEFKFVQILLEGLTKTFLVVLDTVFETIDALTSLGPVKSAMETLGISVDGVSEGLNKARLSLGEFSENMDFEKPARDLAKVEEGIVNIVDSTTGFKDNIKQGLEDSIPAVQQFTAEFEQNMKRDTSKGIQEGVNEVKKKIPPVEVPVDSKKLMEDFKKAFNNPFEVFINTDFSKELDTNFIGAGLGFAKSVTKGSADFVKTAAKGIAMAVGGPLGEIIGEIVGYVVDIFGKAPAEFQKMIYDTIAGIPELLTNIIVNVVSVMTGTILNAVVTGFINGLPQMIEAMTQAMVTQFASPIFWAKIAWSAVGAFVGAIPEMVQGFIDGFRNGVNQVLEPIKQFGKGFEAIFGKLSGLGDLFKGFGKFIGDGLKSVLGGLGDFFGDLGKKIFYGFKGLIEKYSPINLLSKMFKFDSGGKGTVEKFIGLDFPFVKFAEGGMVPGRAKVSGDSLINDTVPALLSPGEVVLPRSMVQGLGLGGVKKDLLGRTQNFGFGSFVQSIAAPVVQAVAPVVNTVTDAATNAANVVGDVVQEITDAVLSVIPNEFADIINALRKLGASINPVDFIKNPKGEAKSAVKGLGTSLFGDGLKKLVTPPALATGGMVPAGYNNDTFPARLSSGELVVDKTTTAQLKSFLNQQGAGSNDQITQVLLTKILDLLERPTTVQSSLEFNQRTFANIIFELSRSNARLAA